MKEVSDETEVFPGVVVSGYDNGIHKDPTWMSAYSADKTTWYGTMRSGPNYNGVLPELSLPILPDVESATRFLVLLNEVIPALRERAIREASTNGT